MFGMTFSAVGLWLARVAKVLALLAFFLPWVVVSCNGDALVQSSGYQLATGTIDLPDFAITPEGQGQAWWAIGALVLIPLGLVLGFVLRGARQRALAMLATSAVSLALVFGGMTQMVSTMRAEVAEKLEEKQGAENDLERQFAQMLGQAMRVDIEVLEGYWLALGALLAAVGGSGVAVAMQRREAGAEPDQTGGVR